MEKSNFKIYIIEFRYSEKMYRVTDYGYLVTLI